MMKRILAVLLALMMMVGAAGALAEDAAPAQSTEPEQLVTVNGTAIYSDNPDIEYWISYYLYMLSSYGYSTEEEGMLEMINQYALENTIRLEIIKQKAKEMGLDQLSDEESAQIDEEAKASWESQLTSIEESAGITEESSDDDRAAARADALAEMEAQGYTEASYLESYRDNAVANLMINRVRDKVSEGLTVSEEDVLKHFQELVDEDKATYENDVSSYEFYTQYYGQPSYYVPEGYRGITHILLKVDDELLNNWKDLSARLEEQEEAAEEAEATAEGTEGTAAESEATAEPVTQEMVDAAKQAILDSVKEITEEIKAKLDAGASFSDLIQEYGTDPGMQSGSDYLTTGYSVHADSILWDPAFTEAAMALGKVGDVSEPVVGQYGVHILHYLRDIAGGAVELTDEMKEQFRSEILEELRSEALNTAIDQWAKEAIMVWTEAGESWKLPEEDQAQEGEADAGEGSEAGETAEGEEAATK